MQEPKGHTFSTTTMHARSTTAILSLFVLTHAFAQQPFCGADDRRDRSPEGRSAEARFFDRLAAHPPQDRGAVLYLPVVFQVIHDNGPENLPDSVFGPLLERVNLCLQNSGPYADTLGHAVNVQLCLASMDPTNAPASGITRHQSPLTVCGFTDEAALKAIVQWDPYRYLNIWVVRDLTEGDYLAYSTFPWSAGTPLDGIVGEATAVLSEKLLVHELGHYLGLFHTFEGGCANWDCAQNGDRICDTPPDATSNGICPSNSCSTELDDTTGLSPFTTDVEDAPNHMDYTECRRAFTAMQAARMHDVVLTTRSTLLTSNGCGMHPEAPPVAACSIDSTTCTGSLTFTTTTPEAGLVRWDIGNDGWDGQGPSFTCTFPVTGDHPVRMAVNTPGGTDTLLFTVHVRVAPTPRFPIISGLDGLANAAPSFDCHGTTRHFVGAPGMVSYLWSTGATTPAIDLYVEDPYSIQLTTVDSNGLAWTDCVPALATVITPELHVVTDVGDTVYCGHAIGLHLTPTDVFARWYVNGQLVGLSVGYTLLPSSIGENQVFAVTNGPGCTTTDVTTITVMAPSLIITQQGNDLFVNNVCNDLAWFHDGQPVPGVQDTVQHVETSGCYYAQCSFCGVSSDSICINATGIQGLEPLNAAALAPVPVWDRLYLRGNWASDSQALLFDAAGRLLAHPPLAELLHGWEADALPPGVYVLHLEQADGLRVLRFLKE